METNSKNNKEEVLEEIVGENTANSNTKKEEEEKDLSQEEKKEDSEDLNTKYLRLMADFQNFKRRSRENESKIYGHPRHTRDARRGRQSSPHRAH